MRHRTVFLLVPPGRSDGGKTSFGVTMDVSKVTAGSFINLTQDRPVNRKEKITIVGRIRSEDATSLR